MGARQEENAMQTLHVSSYRSIIVGLLGLLMIVGLMSIRSRAQQQKADKLTLQSLAARVKYLEDEKDIQDLLIAYERTLDTRDFKAYSELFTRDGEWSGGMGTASGGPQAIYDLMTRSIGGNRGNAAGGASTGAAPRQATIGWGSTYHIMSNFKVDIDGDTAHASSRWTFITAARGPGINLAGRYEDTLAREDGHWKFRKRVATNEVVAPAAGGPAAAPAPAR
jgi:hypothetical protein